MNEVSSQGKKGKDKVAEREVEKIYIRKHLERCNKAKSELNLMFNHEVIPGIAHSYS
jgi:hypothetical protein